ncbi:hypothetical protein QTO34_010106 [Cnephaeus nilssonii]|uniref:IZUMO family member 2 n=1 Tax=Cnephaeus nilssonii TaxID=3371016 RepID=A0AA40LFQ1_CNENI|nr:hypothetical protein QTO34_010106 [Eptesicus nilssonii]
MPLALAVLLLVGLGGGWGCLQCDHSVQEALRQLRLDLIPSRFGREHLRARAQALLLGMEGPFFRDYATNVFVGEIEMYHLDPVAIFAKNQINKLRVDSLRDGPLLEELVTLRRKVTKKLKTGFRSYELKGAASLSTTFLLTHSSLPLLVPYLDQILKLLSQLISPQLFSLAACDRKICHMLTEEVLDCLHCLKTSPKCMKKNDCFVDRQPRTALQYGTESGHPGNQVPLGIVVSLCLAVFAFGVIVASAITYRHNRKLLLQ